MLHSALALILTIFVSGPTAPADDPCSMPRIHYIADTVYVYANSPSPLALRAQRSEPVTMPACPMCSEGHCAETRISEPADSATVVVSEFTVPARKNRQARFFTGPNH